MPGQLGLRQFRQVAAGLPAYLRLRWLRTSGEECNTAPTGVPMGPGNTLPALGNRRGSVLVGYGTRPGSLVRRPPGVGSDLATGDFGPEVRFCHVVSSSSLGSAYGDGSTLE